MFETPAFYSCEGLFDGVIPTMQRGVGLLVGDGRIIAVARKDDVASDTPQIHIAGFLTPGFVDAHTHITIRPGEGRQLEQMELPLPVQTLRGVGNLHAMLASGVTSARILTEKGGIDFAFRDAIARGEVHGPALRVSGQGINAPGGHGSIVDGVRGETELRDTVKQRAVEGADHIKVFATGGVSSTTGKLDAAGFSLAELQAIVDQADSLGLKVAAHAQAGSGIRLAVQAGVHSIEHGSGIDGPTADLIASKGTWVVLTSSILFSPLAIERVDGNHPVIMDKLRSARRAAIDSARILRERGVRIAVGTDSMHGMISNEMQWMAQNGWTSVDALIAATRSGAEVMGLPCAGTFLPGKSATFVVLGSDPLVDISATDDVVAVFQNGYRSHQRNTSQEEALGVQKERDI